MSVYNIKYTPRKIIEYLEEMTTCPEKMNECQINLQVIKQELCDAGVYVKDINLEDNTVNITIDPYRSDKDIIGGMGVFCTDDEITDFEIKEIGDKE